MKYIELIASFIVDGKTPLAGQALNFETFNALSNRWDVLAVVKTKADGSLFSRVRYLSSSAAAPAFRIKSGSDSRAKNIPFDSVSFSYNQRSQILRCNFGKINIIKTKSTTARSVSSAASLSVYKNKIASLEKEITTQKTSASKAVQKADQKAKSKENLAAISAAKVTELTEKVRVKESAIARAVAAKAKVEKDFREYKAKQEKIPTEENRQTPIQKIAENIGIELASANKTMKKSSSAYQLQNIQVELRGTVSDDGSAIALSKLSDAKLGRKINASTLKMEMVATPKTREGAITIPDLSGLTESAVQRVLSSIGLKYERIDQSVSSAQGYSIGQVISQAPASGGELTHGASVLVVIAVD